MMTPTFPFSKLQQTTTAFKGRSKQCARVSIQAAYSVGSGRVKKSTAGTKKDTDISGT